MNQLQKIINGVSFQLYVGALVKSCLIAGSAFLLVSTISSSLIFSIIAALGGFTIGAYFTGIFQNKRPEAIQLIHQTVQDTEYSLQLLEVEKPNIAEQLQ